MEDLPQSVVNFITNYIDSVEQLHILILLEKNPEKEWELSDIVQELRSSMNSVEKRFDDLIRKKIINADYIDKKKFRYSPTSIEMKESIIKVIESYKLKTVKVVNLIFSKPQQNIQSIADAFKFKKGEDK